MICKYMGYQLYKEHDHVKVVGPSDTWRCDTVSEAIKDINAKRGCPREQYNHAHQRRADESKPAYTRKELNEYNGVE